MLPTQSETPGSSIRTRGDANPVPPSSEDALDFLDVLGGASLSTDDTPTTISRNALPPVALSLDESGVGVRGRRLAHFELLEPIGVGGMAAVQSTKKGDGSLRIWRNGRQGS